MQVLRENSKNGTKLFSKLATWEKNGNGIIWHFCNSKIEALRERQCRRETQKTEAKELTDNGYSSKNNTDLEANAVFGSDFRTGR